MDFYKKSIKEFMERDAAKQAEENKKKDNERKIEKDLRDAKLKQKKQRLLDIEEKNKESAKRSKSNFLRSCSKRALMVIVNTVLFVLVLILTAIRGV